MKRLISTCFPFVSALILVFGLNGLLIAQDSAQANQTDAYYISDILLVPLRTGPTIQHRIINAGLRSGTEVILIESDSETQWSRIQVGEQEGWVPTRHLLNQPIARDQLNQLEAELESLRQQYAALQQQNADSELDLTNGSTELARLRTERDDARREIERLNQLSGTEIDLDRQNEKLLAENRTLQAENEQLLGMKASLERDSDQWRMIIGGGLVLAGIVVGLIFPGVARRRRSDGWN
jgi:SH3 domain protein